MGLSSLILRSDIISYIYFRREIVVVSSCLAAFIIMSFEFIVFFIFAVIFQLVPTATILILPLLVLDLLLLSIGFSLILSILNVYFRDIQFIWLVLLQAGFFLSPILYELDMIPEQVRWVLVFNPLVSLIDTAHEIVLYDSLPSTNTLIYLLVRKAGV